MNRLGLLLIMLRIMVIVALLISCSASTETVTITPNLLEKEVPNNLSEVPRITVEVLKERLDNGDAIVVIDTRVKSSYDANHIPGAMAKPENYDKFARDQEIILYCA